MQIQTFEEVIKLQPRGVFTVPKRLREGLFDKSGIAKIYRQGRRLIIEPLKVLDYPVRSYSSSELEDFFDLDAKETQNLKAKGIL